MIDDIFHPTSIPSSALSEHIRIFTAYHLKNYARETSMTYEKALRSFLAFVLQDRSFKFRIQDIERFKNFLEHDKQLKGTSISTYLTALRSFCDYLIECKELQRNPAKRVKGMKKHAGLPHIFTYHELQAFIPDPKNLMEHRDKAMLFLLLGAFLSEQELHKALVGDIIMVDGKPQFHLPDTQYQCIPLPIIVHATLQEYLAHRYAVSPINPKDPLFPSNSNRSKGKHISIRGIRNAVHQRVQNSSMSDERKVLASAYALRHTGGCLLALSGMNVEEIMQRMRLKWPSSAMQYIRLTEKAEIAGLSNMRSLIIL